MSARDEVIEAIARFALATDERDWSTLRAMLTDDAVGYSAHGPDAVVARMRNSLGGVGPTQHLVGNHRVGFDDDGRTARVLTYGRVHHVGAGEAEGLFVEYFGEYDDTWVAADGDWLLARRTFRVTYVLGDNSVLRP